MTRSAGTNIRWTRTPSRGTKLEDRHALMGAVMRSPLRRDLRHAGVLDAELFTQKGQLFVKPVVLCRESHSRIDAMEYCRLNAILPGLGKVAARWQAS